jgi:hypothetical protein
MYKGKNRLEPAKGTARTHESTLHESLPLQEQEQEQEQVVYHLMAVCRVCPAFDSSQHLTS